MPTSTVRVSNLSLDSTEESINDYFSFCGDIQSVTVTESEDARSKEAEIVFESESASSTAVLLNNALVDGRNIQVLLVQDESSAQNGQYSSGTNAYANASNASNSSLNSNAKSVVSEIMSEAKSVASQVSSATRDLNAKYDVTGKLKTAYTTAATTTATTFAHLDSQYKIKENTGKALEATKTGISSVYRQVSGFWAKQMGGSASSMNAAASSTNSASSNASTPHEDTQ